MVEAEVSDDRLLPGGNMPPSPLDIAVAETKAALDEFAARRDEIIANAAKRIPIKDRYDAGKATDLIGIAQDVERLIREAGEKVGKPLHAAHRAVIATAANFWEPADDALEPVRRALHAFKVAAKAAEDKQAADQRAAEALLRAQATPAPRPHIDYRTGIDQLVGHRPAAPAAPAPKAQEIRGDYGYAARSRKKYDVTIDDVSKIPLNILDSRDVKEAIAKVIARMAQSGITSVEGATIDERDVTRVQR